MGMGFRPGASNFCLKKSSTHPPQEKRKKGQQQGTQVEERADCLAISDTN